MRVSVSFLSFFLVTAAVAGPKKPHWGEWQALGDCDSTNTQFLENGDDVSILYDGLGVNMPQQQTGDGLQSRRQCTFRIDVHPPAGKYLSQVLQTYSGGLIKSRQSAAHITVRYRIGTFREKAVDLDWTQGKAVTPEMPASLFSESVDDPVPYEECRKRTRFAVNLVVAGRRKGLDDFVLGGLDSADLRFVHQLKLRPVFRPCR